MCTRCGYRGEKEQDKSKMKLFISKTIKMYIRGFETIFVFSQFYCVVYFY